MRNKDALLGDVVYAIRLVRFSLPLLNNRVLHSL
jgi:hypothetical protein